MFLSEDLSIFPQILFRLSRFELSQHVLGRSAGYASTRGLARNATPRHLAQNTTGGLLVRCGTRSLLLKWGASWVQYGGFHNWGYPQNG